MFYQVYALETNIREQLQGHPWLDINDIGVIIPNLITLVLIVAAVAFLFLIIIAGIRWMTAGGDKEAMVNAKKRLTSAVIGMVIVLSAWAILNLVKYFFNIGRQPGCVMCGGVECCRPYFECVGNVCLPTL